MKNENNGAFSCDWFACGKPIDPESELTVNIVDSTKDYQEMQFCNTNCFKSWLTKKEVGFVIAFIYTLKQNIHTNSKSVL